LAARAWSRFLLALSGVPGIASDKQYGALQQKFDCQIDPETLSREKCIASKGLPQALFAA